jgi:hypothetical protein
VKSSFFCWEFSLKQGNNVNHKVPFYKGHFFLRGNYFSFLMTFFEEGEHFFCGGPHIPRSLSNTFQLNPSILTVANHLHIFPPWLTLMRRKNCFRNTVPCKTHLPNLISRFLYCRTQYLINRFRYCRTEIPNFMMKLLPCKIITSFSEILFNSIKNMLLHNEVTSL